MTAEEWQPVLGWEGLYEVSDLGRVRSVPRRVPGGNGSHASRGGRILAQAADRQGYRKVSLSDRTRRPALPVHRLVLDAFDRPRPDGMQARHLDGDPGNNARANLVWGTGVENWDDRRRHGTASSALARGACPHGQAWTEANTYLGRNGSPRCRTCRRDGMRRKTA